VGRRRSASPRDIGPQDRVPVRMRLPAPLPPPPSSVDNISLTQPFSNTEGSNFALDVAHEIL
jgi:hypothetical protein